MSDEQKRKLSPLSPVRSVGRGLSFTARQFSRVVRNPFGRQESTPFASTAAEAQTEPKEGSAPFSNLRLWSPFKKAEPSSLLRVKLYDFAVYMDGHQIQQSALSRRAKRRQGSEPDAAFFKALRSSDDVSMSLMVRAARNLPIPILAKEYERILKRRLQIVGGSANDAALHSMLECFKKERLPSGVIDGNSVRKGAVLTFTKDTEGHLTAKANNDELLTVRSPKLGQAIFDLYLGDNPVSRKAKLTAGQAASELMAGRGYQAPPEQGICDLKDAEGCQLSLL